MAPFRARMAELVDALDLGSSELAREGSIPSSRTTFSLDFPMRILLQRVKEASVAVDGEVISAIKGGLLLLVAIAPDDTAEVAALMAKKVANMRIFSDENGKMNHSLLEVPGEVLLVSQFTLYADLSHGRRPYFGQVAAPAKASELVDLLRLELEKLGLSCQSGRFGADMQVALVNDGPVTIIMDSAQL